MANKDCVKLIFAKGLRDAALELNYFGEESHFAGANPYGYSS